MKTKDLTEIALDWAVVIAQGDIGVLADPWYAPSSNWKHGGAIIERERIALRYDNTEQEWQATYPDEDGWVYGWGSTPLVAAMRCFVASKLGDEVEIPEELK